MERRFDILEIPGTGAQAAVCLARDHARGRLVCLKVLRTAFHASSSEAARVRDEARILGRLAHPGIVRLHEALDLGGRQVLVMEWVDGPPVARIVRRHGSLDAPVACAVARQVAEAVAFAYDLPLEDGQPFRLVHRDLNPANVLLGVDGRVRVLDFGMARGEFDDRETVTHVALLGTQGFVAPEGLSGIADNPKLDVYSLGITLFLMLTGHLPVLSRQRLAHQAGLDEQLAFLVRHLTERGVDPAPHEALLRALCAWHPDERPTMREVVERLGALADDGALSRFADTAARALHDGRARIPPRQHEAWSELAFLQAGQDASAEHPAPTDDLSAAPIDVDARVQELLNGDRWPAHPDALAALLRDTPGWSEGPLLQALRPYAAPWWRAMFVRPLPVEGALVLLDALAHRPTPEVIALCRRLTRHRDARLAERAERIAAAGAAGFADRGSA